MRLISGSGRSPREGKGNPLQFICLGNPVEGGAWLTTIYGYTQIKLLDMEWINKELLYRTENYIQYPEINHKEKEYKKCLYVCITESLLSN